MNLSQQQYYFKEMQRRQALLRAYYNLQTQKVGVPSENPEPQVTPVAISKLQDVQTQRDNITSVRSGFEPPTKEDDTVLSVGDAIKRYRNKVGLETNIEKIDDIKTNTETLVKKLNGEI